MGALWHMHLPYIELQVDKKNVIKDLKTEKEEKEKKKVLFGQKHTLEPVY